MALSLLLASFAVSVVGAFASLLFRKSEMAAKSIGCFFGVVAAVCSLGAGLLSILAEPTIISVDTIFMTFSLRLDALGGIMTTVISVLALAAWIYGQSYFDEYKGMGIGVMCFFMNLFVASMLGVITVDNAFWFLVFFELMSLTSYFLVVTEQNEASIKGGFMYFVMAHVGFLMIMISFLIMVAQTGSFEFADFRGASLSPVLASVCFFLAFFGFGFKAGMIPFHSWLPMAHPAAPSNVSALMSGGMIKIGIFGIVKVAFDLLGSGEPLLVWGIVVLLFGAVSSVLGVTYALSEHDIKRLLAYHSVENIGIILLGLGVALIGAALGNDVLAVIGMLACLFHLINHAMFKGLLFLGAGSVLYATGTRNMEVLGGLQKTMPTTSFCFLVGSLAISAIPPLNGFVSEWFTYQGMITAAMENGGVIMFVCGFGVVMLAITGALAVTCFVKAFGVTFLGAPRSDVAKQAKEVPAPMKFAMIILSIICVVLGVCAPWIVPVLTAAATNIVSLLAVGSAEGALLLNPSLESVISTPLLAVLMIAVFVLVFAVAKAKSKGGTSNLPDPWACGYLPTADMPLVANSVGAQVKHFWKPLFVLRDTLSAKSAVCASCFRGLSSWAKLAQNWGDIALVEPTSKFVRWLGGVTAKIECGNFRIYIVYIVVTLVLFLSIAVALV